MENCKHIGTIRLNKGGTTDCMSCHAHNINGITLPKHFDFCDWQQAFEFFYEMRRDDETVNLVICTHWAASGYWVEQFAQPDAYALIYQTKEEVDGLLQRIKDRGEEVVGLDSLKRKDCISLGGLVI